jgi:hypothetical protein
MWWESTPRLIAVKNRGPFYRRQGGPQGRSGRMDKISTPTGLEPRTVQHVAIRYTDWAIAALQGTEIREENIEREKRIKYVREEE